MSSIRNAASVAVVALALLAGPSARAGQVYLSLGDSLAFGLDPSDPTTLVPSYGDQGFVRVFADSLAGANGGVRPAVLNLGVPGETSASLLDPAAHSPFGPPRAWGLNQNYADGAIAQNALMLSRINAVQGAGDEISDVSLIFGANDIFALVGSPAYQLATPGQQQAMVGQTILAALNNYAFVLSELQAVAPSARVYLPGYYNPYPAALAPAEHAMYDLVLGAFNPGLESIAGHFGATYVDTHSLFAGHELEMTNIRFNDVHPNRAGYRAIGAALGLASVPEPSGVVSLGLGLAIAGAAAAGRRRLARPRTAA